MTSLDMLSKQQNKLVRIIYNSEYDANTEIIYKNLKIVKFIKGPSLFLEGVGKIKGKNGGGPNILDQGGGAGGRMNFY